MNTYHFNNQEGVRIFLNLIHNEPQINLKVDDFIKFNPGKCQRKNNFQILGMVLKESKLISNSKIIYDLKRFSKNPQIICKYYFDQCQKLLDLLSVEIENDDIYIIVNQTKKILGKLENRSKNERGRLKGQRNLKTKNLGWIKKIHPDIEDWISKEQYIIKNLEQKTFSLYSFEEFKEGNKNNILHTIKKTRRIKRSLFEFKNNSIYLFYEDSFKRMIKIEFKYRIYPIGKAKQMIQSEEILIDANKTVNFFIELGVQVDFEDFAIGYYRECDSNLGFKIGTTLLINETEKESKKEIEEKRLINYSQLTEIPDEVVKTFFKARDLNFLKPPTMHIKTFKSLNDTLYKLQSKPKDLAIFQYTFFVSMPLIFDDPSENEYDNRMELYKDFKNCLDPNLKVNFSAENLSLEEYLIEVNNNSFIKNLDKISVSRYFVLLIPELRNSVKTISKAFFELGVASYIKRPILIVYHINNEDLIPVTMSSHRIAYSVRRPLKKEDILNFIIQNNTDFF